MHLSNQDKSILKKKHCYKDNILNYAVTNEDNRQLSTNIGVAVLCLWIDSTFFCWSDWKKYLEFYVFVDSNLVVCNTVVVNIMNSLFAFYILRVILFP